MTGVFKSAKREKLFKYSGRLVDDNVVKQADLTADDVTVLPTPLARLANHLIVGRNVRDGDAMLARINKAIAECTKDCTLAKIMAKYDEE